MYYPKIWPPKSFDQDNNQSAVEPLNLNLPGVPGGSGGSDVGGGDGEGSGAAGRWAGEHGGGGGPGGRDRQQAGTPAAGSTGSASYNRNK